ncbi:MAG: enoyl-CoA hydratase-related protein [Clostridia bacterium]|nr:enoyl-CoA hydratase-related protein [Clostridia bacterium]
MSDLADETVILHVDQEIAVITISGPASLNALGSTVLAELGQALAQVRINRAIRALIITGAGSRAFVAGADIAEMRDLTPEGAVAFSRRGQAVFAAIEELPMLSIAAVNGYALGGGCELALACDIRIASSNAQFAQPETGLGIIPGFGATVRLPLAVGRSRAAQMILTGRKLNADEALSAGLVSEVVAQDALLARALEIARDAAAKSPTAIAHAKRCLAASAELFEREAEEFGKCFETDQPREGMSAFLERRRPEFSR